MEASVLAPIEPSASRSNLATTALRDAILSGRLKPGDALVERHVAELLGISKTPVREALIALTASGLVVSNGNSGVVVRQMSTADVREIYGLRLLLEPWAIANAAHARTRDVIEQAGLALQESAVLLESGDTEALILANRSFHRELYSSCGNALVVKCLDELQDLTALAAVSILWKRHPSWREEYSEHRKILTAVKKGDPKTAERLSRSHIQSSLMVLATLDSDADAKSDL